MPPTVVTENPEEARRAVDDFGRAVFKPLFTSKARGMTIIESGSDTEAKIGAFRSDGNTLMYIQKALDLPGRDLGLMFVGGEYIGTYARVAGQDAWNTTSAAGGHYEPADPEAQLIELARRAQAPFGLDFTSVDLAITNEGPVVFEVSAFGGFRGMKEAKGIDVANHFVDHVLNSVE
ncbi:MAG: ATP-grasp family protein, partial [Planctomycetota bacterium]